MVERQTTMDVHDSQSDPGRDWEREMMKKKTLPFYIIDLPHKGNINDLSVILMSDHFILKFTTTILCSKANHRFIIFLEKQLQFLAFTLNQQTIFRECTSL